jgi:hypothetical protein
MMWSACTLRQHLWAKRDYSGKLCAIRACAEQGEFANDNWGLGTLDIVHTGPAATLDIHTSVEEQARWLIEQNPDYLLTYPSVVVALVEHFRQQSLQDDYAFQNLGSTPPSGDGSYEDRSYARQSVDGSRPLTRLREVRTFGEVGRVVITTLQNFAMPLIRYDIGDYAEVGPPCSCGRGLPVLRRILGRKRNMFILPSGQRRWPCMDTNGQPDYLDAGPLQAADNDLVPVNLAFIQNGLPQSKLEKLRIGISGNTGNSPSGNYSPGSIKLWDSVTKNNLIEPETTWQANALPGTLYMESVSSSGAAGLVLVLEEIEEESGSPGYSVSLVHFDYVQVTSISLDLDIDSDNDDGFNYPEGDDWEEYLEDSPYGIGKMLSREDTHFTPARLKLSPGLDISPNSPIRIRFDYDIAGESGVLKLWNTFKADPARSNQAANAGGNRIMDGEEYELSELNYDPASGALTIYLETFIAHDNHSTKEDVETNGKPDERIKAVLVASGNDLLDDEVKYMHVIPDTFYPHLQIKEELRNAMASEKVYAMADAPNYALKLMSPQELKKLGVPDYLNALIGEGSGINGFKALAYWDHVSGKYVISFAGTDDVHDVLVDIWQGLGGFTQQCSMTLQ